jgi:FkbM family methyltransferase
MFPNSDELVFDQIFVREEYAPACRQLRKPAFILDLGANVGYASAFFASRYPGARILAVEPDPENFELCAKNLKPYGDRIKVLKGAVWPFCSRLAISHEAGDGWASQVLEPAAGEEAIVDAWNVSALLKIAGASTIDLLKVDIEGSEAALFGSYTAEWLCHVRNICIELHDDECCDNFRNALKEFEYERLEHGEFTICLNLHMSHNSKTHPAAAGGGGAA